MFNQVLVRYWLDGASLPETGPDAKNLSIQDPDSENPNDYLTGQAAFQKIIAKSSLGKGGLSYGVPNYLAQAASIEENNLDDSTEEQDIEDQHRDTGESSVFDPTKNGTSEYRLITLKENLSPEEQVVFDQRIEALKATNVLTEKKYTRILREARNFNPNEWPRTTRSRGIEPEEIDRTVDYTTYNGKTVLPCASMIECLLYINSKIKVRGEFDLDRGWIKTSGGKGSNLNDHVCGRGIDIFYVGESEDNLIYLGNKDVNKFKNALNILLPVLASMPPHLHPDLMVVHDGLADEYGIKKQVFEINTSKNKSNGILQKQYSMLEKIDFSPDEGHRDHIHLAFSPYRAGNYKDWAPSNPLNDLPFDEAIRAGLELGSVTPPSASDIAQLFTTYSPGTAVPNKDALYRSLIQYAGFTPEVSAIFMMLAERESNFQPGVFAADEDDYSIGLFQTNYSDTTIAREKITSNSFIARVVQVSSLQSDGTIKNEQIKLWKLIIKDWQTLGINNAKQAWDKIRELRLQGTGREQIDPRLFQPINQINLLVSYVRAYTKRWKFTSWGEYENGPEYGWINRTKFQTAVDYYIRNNPGKTKEDLVRWARPLLKNMIIEKSRTNFEAWLNGQTFGF